MSEGKQPTFFQKYKFYVIGYAVSAIVTAVLGILLLKEIDKKGLYKYEYEEGYARTRFETSDTIIEVKIEIDRSDMIKLISQIRGEIKRTDSIINVYNPFSEISIINKKSRNKVSTNFVNVSEEVYGLVKDGIKYSKASDGVFDITCLPYLRAWGFGENEHKVLSDKEIEIIGKRVSYTNIILNEEEKNFSILTNAVEISFGAYGKGYILRKLKNLFLNEGYTNFLINFGGDIIANGKNPKGIPWVIGVKHPREAGVLISTNKINNESIVTSGDYERFFEKDGIRYHHILNAKEGRPARNVLSATIIAKDPLHADALSTVAFILGKDFFKKNFNYRFALIMYKEEGEIKTIKREKK